MGRLIKNILVRYRPTFICLLVFGVYIQFANGQIGDGELNLPQEEIRLVVNDEILLSGQDLCYKIYCLTKENKSFSNLSKMVYVDLIGANNVRLFSHKHKLENGLANGDFFIPSHIKTGNYKLIAYTVWMIRQANPVFSEKNVHIINPFVLEKNTSIKVVSDEIEIFKEAGISSMKNDGKIELSTNLGSYKTRSKGVLTIRNNIDKAIIGNYIISIRKFNFVNSSQADGKSTINKIKKENRSFFPEVRGEVLSGRVVGLQDGLPAVNKIVAFSIPGVDYVYKNVKTDTSGKFHFDIYENYDSTDAILQVVDNQRENFRIVLDSFSLNQNNDMLFSNLVINPNVKEWVIQQSIYNQIQNAYHYLKSDSLVSRNQNIPFYGNPTATYKLNDFKRFPSLRETFVEIVEEAAIRKDNDQYRFKVYNYDEYKSNYPDAAPLVLVDGILIQDPESIIGIDATKLDVINIVMGIYYYGPSVYDGIIDIKTKRGDFKLMNSNLLMYSNLKSIERERVFYEPDYTSNANKLERIPDYRSQLLWMPSVFLDFNEKNIEFYTSDIEGTFEILLEGYNSKGEYLVNKQYFEVKD